MSPDDDADELQGAIEYPFIERTDPIGRDGKDDKFVIRSAQGSTEYTIEIPSGGRNYDIEVPIADLKNTGPGGDAALLGAKGKPQTTDREFVRAMPKLPEPQDRALTESAYGLGHPQGPRQAPSYTINLAKINKLYQDKNFELALIEVNNLVTFYPSSSQLFKMKGTVLMKMRNYKLAEEAWTRGSELAPEDTALQKALQSLRNRITTMQKTAAANAPAAANPGTPYGAPASNN